MPSLTSMSLWQMPHASTRTRTCRGPGSGMSRSTNSQSPPGLLICAAFIFMLFFLSLQVAIQAFASIFNEGVVGIAVEPAFARLGGCNDRVAAGTRVFAGVLVG